MPHVASGDARVFTRRPAVFLATTALLLSLLASLIGPGRAHAAAPEPATAAAAHVVAAHSSLSHKRLRLAAVARRAEVVRRAGNAHRAAYVRAGKVSTLLETAAALRGRPYRYGARGPRAFDCSGFTGWVMRRAGESLPRTSSEQYAASRKISKAQIRPGDLVFFRSGSHVYHVAIYAGHDRIWHARQPGQGVALTPISSHNWVAGRVL